MPFYMMAQIGSEPGKYLPKPTAKGIGKIDTRIDNMRYWKRMADSDFVYLTPNEPVPPAIYKGSRIESPVVMTTDSPDVLTTTVNSTQSENSVFVDPEDNLFLMNSNNSTQNPVGSLYGADYLISSDGGTTWGGSVSGADGSNSGDPATAIGLGGRMYIGFIDDASGQSVAYSDNDGASWTSVVASVQSGDLLDKNHMWIDNSSTSPYEGNVYVSYTDFGATGYPVEITRSTNDGISYSTPLAISAGVAAGSHCQGVNIQTGPNGEVYVIWAIYDSWPSDEAAIGFAKSTNQGSTWSTPFKVNQDASSLGKQHYFPWVTCDRLTGEVSVIFYDDRNVTSTQCEVFVSSSSNGGTSWSDFKVSDVAFTPAPISGLASSYMGDYLGISAVGSKVYPTWTDNRTGTTLTYTSPFSLSPVPTALFSANNTTPCTNQTVAFTDQSSQNPTSWNWTITPAAFTYMNSTGPASQNPQIQFTALGNYTVRLIVSNSYGADTLIKSNYIAVNSANADFSASATTIIVDNNVTFTDQSTCNISSFSWNFGSGATPATANTQGPHTVTYSTEGYKTVSLTVNGSVTKTRTDYIHVLPLSFNIANGTLTTCAGLFYDHEGTSDYLNNEDYTMTLMPGDTSMSVQAVFSEFSLESESSFSYDYLKVYDGTSTSATLLGTWCGTTSPGTVVATNAVGALTFKFHSDVSVVSTGWVASLSCVLTPVAPPASYCAAGSSYTNCDEYISRVQIGTIDNATTCSSPGGYGNYTSISTKVSPTISYPVTVTNGRPYSADQCGIWVDWNHDSDFGDAGETITITGTPGNGPYTATIIPPANTSKGSTRMRIRITYTETVSSCGTTTYGEVEDYNLWVGTRGLWNGGTSGSETNWNTANNWDDGRVPSSGTDVIIPAGSTYYPVVSGAYSCLDVEIKDGASMTVQTGLTMNVAGDLTIGQGSGGLLLINGGTCNVTGVVYSLPGSTLDIKNGGILNN
jgi:PKD repeat protein